MTKTVVIAGALDTKGADLAFVKQAIERHGLATLLIDFGVLGAPAIQPDIGNAEVAKAGGGELQQLRASRNKTVAMQVMTSGLIVIVQELHAKGKLQGILSMGGPASIVHAVSWSSTASKCWSFTPPGREARR